MAATLVEFSGGPKDGESLVLARTPTPQLTYSTSRDGTQVTHTYEVHAETEITEPFRGWKAVFRYKGWSAQ